MKYFISLILAFTALTCKAQSFNPITEHSEILGAKATYDCDMVLDIHSSNDIIYCSTNFGYDDEYKIITNCTISINVPVIWFLNDNTVNGWLHQYDYTPVIK